MSWNVFEAALFGLGQIVFVIYFLLFILCLSVERKVSSAVISLLVLAVSNGVMTAITPMLYDFSSNVGLVYWYAGFMLIDFLAVYLLYKCHDLFKQNVSAIAHLVGLSFCILATIQTLRYIDRIVMDTEWLQLLYQYGIPMLHLIMVPFIVALWVFQDNNVVKKSQVMQG